MPLSVCVKPEASGVQISNSHSTYFIEGKQATRADMRVALIVYRPARLRHVTGL
jgi:hypothetical protein